MGVRKDSVQSNLPGETNHSCYSPSGSVVWQELHKFNPSMNLFPTLQLAGKDSLAS